MKLLNLLICVATVAVLFASCKKQELEIPTTSSFERKLLIIGDSIKQTNCANYSLLKFKNKDAFLNTLVFLSTNSVTNDSILDDFEGAFTFTNLRNSIKSLPNDSLKIIEFTKITEVLASVVSKDSIIQIDTLGFLFDFENEFIYELYPVTCANLSILKMKQEVNNDSMYVMRYNFYDPVFHPSGYEPYTGKAFRWLKKIFGGCEDIWAPSAWDVKSKSNYSTVINFPFVEYFSYYTQHIYRRYAVYFEIKREWHHYKGDLTRGTPFAVPVAFSHYDNWKEFCGSWGGSSNWPNSTYGLNSSLTFKTYQSSNSLARNKNQVKSYLWFIPPGIPNSPISSPNPINLNDLNF